jgi:hypothetical protein
MSMPTPVDGHSNLHTAACYRQPLGVRCRACERRVLVPLDRLSARGGDMTPLHTLALKCSACGGRRGSPRWALYAVNWSDPTADSIAPLNMSGQAVTSDTTPADADAGKVAHLEDH